MDRQFPSADRYDGSADDAPVSKLWYGILIEGLRAGEERIQVTPPEPGQGFAVRAYREGAWRDLIRPPRDMYELFIRRLKVMASFNMVRRLPLEEGRIKLAHRGEVFEVRASVRSRADGLEEATVELPELPPNKRLKLAARVD